MSSRASTQRHTSRGDSGFTLVELLAVISILGVISFALTEAVISGLKTTDGTASRISGAVASQTLASYFAGDVQSASDVSTSDTTCATDPVFLRLQWTDQAVNHTVSYSLDPPSGKEQRVIRWACTGGAVTPDKRIMGLFTREPTGPLPVEAFIGSNPCPSPAISNPDLVTLRVKTDPTAAVSCIAVERRA